MTTHVFQSASKHSATSASRRRNAIPAVDKTLPVATQNSQSASSHLRNTGHTARENESRGAKRFPRGDRGAASATTLLLPLSPFRASIVFRAVLIQDCFRAPHPGAPSPKLKADHEQLRRTCRAGRDRLCSSIPSLGPCSCILTGSHCLEITAMVCKGHKPTSTAVRWVAPGMLQQLG